MAGIGFELKKMFAKKGLLPIVRAYGYAGVVCTGPMLLGVALLLGIRLLAEFAGVDEHSIELLNSMVQYTLLFSLVLTSACSMITTRYTADQLYMDRKERVIPSFWGSSSILMVIGAVVYGIFLLFAGIGILYGVLCMILLGELILVWTEMGYLTAVKDYGGIMKTFSMALVIAFGAGFLLVTGCTDKIAVLLADVCIAYGIMCIRYYVLLAKYFPKGKCSSLHFLEWMDKYPQLVFVGLFVAAGLYGHLLIMWRSPLQVQIQGLFVAAPGYDIPALLAFFSILITTINFVTSVEVNFYPKYRNYFALFNEGGSYMDIRQAEREMKTTLIQELTYTYTKQFFATIVFIIAGTFFLPYLPLGMTADMLGIYRVLCVGYAFYAAGNCAMLILLYFADNKGALISVTVFMLVSCAGTLLLKDASTKYYGVGFLAGSIAFAATALFLLYRYLRQLVFHVLCGQPVAAVVKRGKMSELSEYFQKKYVERYHVRDVEESETE